MTTSIPHMLAAHISDKHHTRMYAMCANNMVTFYQWRSDREVGLVSLDEYTQLLNSGELVSASTGNYLRLDWEEDE